MYLHSYYIILLISLFITTSCSSVLAQSDDIPAKIRWGEQLQEPANSRITKVISTDKNGFHILRIKDAGAITNQQVYIEQYDNSLTIQRSAKLDLKYKGKQRAFEDAAKIGGQLYLFTSYNNQAQKKNYLFYQTLSKRLQPARSLVKIAEIDTRSKSNTGSFNLLVSRDSSKVLLYNQLANKKREPEQFALRVFDNQLNPIWSRDIILPYNDNQFVIEDYRVDKSGNVYLVGLRYMDGIRNSRQGQPNYEYVILAYTKDGEQDKEYRIDIKEKFITDLTFRINNSGSLVCAGFYSERTAYTVKGTCFFHLDPQTQQVKNLSFQEFDFDFRTSLMSESQQRRAARAESTGDNNREAELYRFSLDELILRSDGGAVVVAEQYYIFERTYPYWNGVNVQRFDTYYNYNDILVVNIRPDGSIEWATRIPKRQETVNDGGYFSSYAMSTVRDRLYFIFNDNSRNYEPGGNDNRLYNYNGRNSIITLAEVSKGGELKMYPLFPNRETGTITRPKICKQIGSRRMMIYGEIGRTYRFSELTFE
jgi:hypothetical protein